MTVRDAHFRFSSNLAVPANGTYPTRGLIQIHEAADALSIRGFDVASPAALATALKTYLSEGGQMEELI